MKCDDVQAGLSAFLDNEESTSEIEHSLSHLYACSECQYFFNSAVKLRSMIREEQVNFPAELDASLIGRREIRRTITMGHRIPVPAYVLSVAAVLLIVVSFAFGFLLQQNVHEDEIKSLLKSKSEQVLYSMPTQVVYPVSNRELKGEVR